MSQTDHMTAVEVAARLGKSLATVKRYARAGKLPVSLKVPGTTGAYLFDRAAIEQLAEAQAVRS